MTRLPPYRGGKRAITVALALGVLGLLATVIGYFITPRQTAFSYLTAYSFFCSTFAGGLIWLLTFHASSARWPVVLRRPLEIIASSGPLFAALFIPIAVGMSLLYPWVSPDPARGEHFLQLMHHKAGYLNPTAFLIRTAIYFTAFSIFGNLLLRDSRRSDDTSEHESVAVRIRMRRVGSVGLPIVGLSITFAAFDWLMSMQPEWYSTIFGIYWFAGGFAAAMALWILCVVAADRAGLLPDLVRPAHYHSMGKLLFAFLCFWAYIAFSQLLLIWIGNLPDEITYYSLRRRGGWLAISLLLVAGHFVIPFLIMLSRDFKRDARRLSWMAIWVLIIHWVDSWWMVMPLQRPHPFIGWQDISCLCAIGGLLFAFALWRFRGHSPAPTGDPYFEASRQYDK